MLPPRVRLVEVGPRDGLQNECRPLTVASRVQLVDDLTASGLAHIEVGSFVSPRWVPQMADSAAVFQGIARRPGIVYAALTPNLRGFEAALAAGASEVAVFAAASEAFSQRNINCSIAESLQRFVPLLDAARQAGLRVRGYVSCVLGCPYQGPVAPAEVAAVAGELLALGCYEISLGDTLGLGTAGATRALIDQVGVRVPRERLAGHFPRHLWPGHDQCLRQPAGGRRRVRWRGGRPGWLPLRAGRHRQCRQRRPALSAPGAGHRDRRGAGAALPSRPADLHSPGS
ncbi:isopropylmalate/homocitrate/citramalate synthase [Pseudomonas psychrotolerans]|nr:isopropylmalate/homocitrate/citramalate synthase [Pseudomonas psychrotolerans]